jgi:predicted GTPase
MEVGEAGVSRSCTTKVVPSKVFPVDRHNVVLLDTPGFDNTQRKDLCDIISEIEEYLQRQVPRLLNYF